MLERLNYYVLSSQVRVDRDAMVDTLARVTHASLFGARSQQLVARRRVGAEHARLQVAELARPGRSTRPRP